MPIEAETPEAATDPERLAEEADQLAAFERAGGGLGGRGQPVGSSPIRDALLEMRRNKGAGEASREVWLQRLSHPGYLRPGVDGERTTRASLHQDQRRGHARAVMARRISLAKARATGGGNALPTCR